jgi:hypothetical protein
VSRRKKARRSLASGNRPGRASCKVARHRGCELLQAQLPKVTAHHSIRRRAEKRGAYGVATAGSFSHATVGWSMRGSSDASSSRCSCHGLRGSGHAKDLHCRLRHIGVLPTPTHPQARSSLHGVAFPIPTRHDPRREGLLQEGRAKRAPAPMLARHMERISALPKTRQKFVIEALESVLAKQGR